MFSTGSTDIRRMSFRGGFLDHSDDWKDVSRSPCGDDGAIRLWDLYSGEPLQMLRRDRLYEQLTITGIQGLTEAQQASLRALGAFEDTRVGR
jgi:hypothetical protein